jgi:hypothetical protein
VQVDALTGDLPGTAGTGGEFGLWKGLPGADNLVLNVIAEEAVDTLTGDVSQHRSSRR